MYLYTFTYLQIIRFGYKNTSYEYFIFIPYNFLIFLFLTEIFYFRIPFVIEDISGKLSVSIRKFFQKQRK